MTDLIKLAQEFRAGAKQCAELQQRHAELNSPVMDEGLRSQRVTLIHCADALEAALKTGLQIVRPLKCPAVEGEKCPACGATEAVGGGACQALKPDELAILKNAHFPPALAAPASRPVTDEHDCTESAEYQELERVVLALDKRTPLPADKVEAMKEAHARWVVTREQGCNSFREAFNAGFVAALGVVPKTDDPQAASRWEVSAAQGCDSSIGVLLERGDDQLIYVDVLPRLKVRFASRDSKGGPYDERIIDVTPAENDDGSKVALLPAQGEPVVDDALVERACKAVAYSIRPSQMRAALVATLTNEGENRNG